MQTIKFISGLSMVINVDYLNPLGCGTTREVYDFPDMPDVVLKREYGYTFRINQREYGTYKELVDSGSPYVKYLAKCLDISECGQYLLQERIECTFEDLGYDIDLCHEDEDGYNNMYDFIPALQFVPDIFEANAGRRKDGTYCIIDYAAGLEPWLHELRVNPCYNT